MPPPALLDVSTLDCSTILDDLEAIRQVNPQRLAMEQLTAIVLFDAEKQLVVGYKDVLPDEFWVPGHMPNYPLLPGVLMCEAAAQLCSYFVAKAGLLHGAFLGFGGLENVRFRSPVRPGERLILVSKMTKYHRRRTTFSVQGFVGTRMVFEGDIIGVAMNRYDEGGEEG